MSDYTTRTQITAEVNYFYDRVLLLRATPMLQHTKFGQVRDIPRKVGTSSIKFRRYESLSAATTALTEGTTPAGSQLSVTDVTATVYQYGDYVTITDVLDYESQDPVLTEAAEVLGEQAGDTLDQLARDVLVAGTNVQYHINVAYGVVVDAERRTNILATDVLNATAVKKAVRTLQNGKAKKLRKIVNSNTGYLTTPINAAYIGIVHSYTLYDLKGATGWIPVEKYAEKGDIMDGEVGALDDVRFVLSENAKKFSSAGSGSTAADVYATLIFGKEAYGVTRISGEAMKNIVKPLGSAGTADPLNQRATSGWKATFITKILNDDFMIRIEHGATA